MQPDPSQPAGTDLREYLSILRYRKWSILLVTLLVTGSAVAFSLRATPVYTSTARIQVLPALLPGTTSTTPPIINMETERGLVDSAAVAELVREGLELDDPIGTILGPLDVSVEANTEILDIAYTDPDPALAQRMADGFSEQYLIFRTQQASEPVEAKLAETQAQMDDVREEIEAVQASLNASTDPVEQQDLETDVSVATSELADLKTTAGELQRGLNFISAGQVVQPAELPRSRSDAGPIKNGVVAFLLGLALGVGFAFLRERLDDRLRGRGDLERYSGHPVLTVIPKVANWRNKDKVLLVSVAQPKSAASEAYRALRTSVQFIASKEQAKVIMVVSAVAGEGKTTTSANLAVVLAQAGKRVILVSADLRKPRVHRYFNLNNDKGLTNVMSGEAPLDKVLMQTDTWNLQLLTSGPTPARPAELLQSQQMGVIIDDLRNRADYVIVDSAPILVVSDTLALAPIVDGILFVAAAEATTRQAVGRSREQLDQVGAHIMGGVLNNFDPQSARDHGYSYGYYYRYSYTGPPQAGGVQPYGPTVPGRAAAPRPGHHPPANGNGNGSGTSAPTHLEEQEGV